MNESKLRIEIIGNDVYVKFLDVETFERAGPVLRNAGAKIARNFDRVYVHLYDPVAENMG